MVLEVGKSMMNTLTDWVRAHLLVHKDGACYLCPHRGLFYKGTSPQGPHHHDLIPSPVLHLLEHWPWDLRFEYTNLRCCEGGAA
jgi:hypothetical protein